MLTIKECLTAEICLHQGPYRSLLQRSIFSFALYQFRFCINLDAVSIRMRVYPHKEVFSR